MLLIRCENSCLASEGPGYFQNDHLKCLSTAISIFSRTEILLDVAFDTFSERTAAQRKVTLIVGSELSIENMSHEIKAMFYPYLHVYLICSLRELDPVKTGSAPGF